MGNRIELSRLAVLYHPGVTLSEKLSEMGMSIEDFSLESSTPKQMIESVINGTTDITADMAESFEKVTKIPASFWIRKQQAFNEYRGQLERN